MPIFFLAGGVKALAGVLFRSNYFETLVLINISLIRFAKFFYCIAMELVRQLEADILTISRGNSILVLSCFFKVSKYISECRPR